MLVSVKTDASIKYIEYLVLVGNSDDRNLKVDYERISHRFESGGKINSIKLDSNYN